MSTVEYCPADGCWLHAGHRCGHGRGGTPGTALVCVCDIPRPTPTDMCSTCLRVIAEQVRARRERAS